MEGFITRPDLVAGVSDTIAEILGIGDRRDQLTADTELFGSLPELDSLSVLELATALETKYDLVIDDEDFTGEVFESIGSLADFIGSRSAEEGDRSLGRDAAPSHEAK